MGVCVIVVVHRGSKEVWTPGVNVQKVICFKMNWISVDIGLHFSDSEMRPREETCNFNLKANTRDK